MIPVGTMDVHRRVTPLAVELLSVEAPFSSFSWVESNLCPTEAIKRCFSLARAMGVRSLVVEDIPAKGVIAAENKELLALAPDYQMGTLKRLSFWREALSSAKDLASVDAKELCGYALVKWELIPSSGFNRWHIFEAVFRKYQHEHNCVPRQNDYTVRIADAEFTLPGVLYAQQNTLTKVCAHVALRTLLGRCLAVGDVCYAEMNRIARAVNPSDFNPSNGLSVAHIRAILSHYGVPFRDIDYDEEDRKEKKDKKKGKKPTTKGVRATHPFRKFLYAGIESGRGALLGFKMTGPAAGDSKHIIPFFGHTFNKDTWVPDADSAYFNIGGGIGYIPSESWTSSFLGHDDNFGPNLCVPRLYVTPEQAEYVVELLHDKVAYSGVQAEAVSLLFLYSLRSHLDKSENPWVRRLANASDPNLQRVVLRALCVARDAYIEHITNGLDWGGHKENPSLVNVLEKFLPERLWVVEISLPHLFQANERKLGEILLNPFIPFDANNPVDDRLYLLARLPGRIFALVSRTPAGPNFQEVDSACASHRPLMKL